MAGAPRERAERRFVFVPSAEAPDAQASLQN
jgi:hypothetical protein